MEVAQGYCTNHDTPLPKINGPDGNVCLMCQGKKLGEGNTAVGAKDPGEDKMRAMLAAAGVPIGRPKEVTQHAPQTAQQAPVVVMAGEPFEKYIEKALKIMEAVPMPKDIKQFKAVNKIIVELKKLSGESDAK